ncbi:MULTISPECIES: helix-turn-helix domain-containing protein [unclassified Nocardia]|uniref:MmyB family transcriptional regulator n=1 Tax=unclassified Nocardia TaxID=2637762 RepID=UPI0024A84DBD|nr:MULTISPECIES: helix-turn-helix domain-containing protein [unclassified Nocardia]
MVVVAQSEFAEFLVARRAQLQPEQVGLPPGRRRRTPGLRREEVAALAGVSVDYLARLEQGRDTNPSASVLAALADALRLTAAERQHFLRITFGMEPAACPTAGKAHERVSETLQAVLDTLHPTPALLVGRRLNILACNPAWRDFATPLGLLDESNHGNLARYIFGNSAAAQHIRNWPEVADMYISALRSACAHWTDDSELHAVVAALRSYPEFAHRWHSHRVIEHRTGIMRLNHPERGDTEVEIETMSPTLDQGLMVWLVDRKRAHTPSLRLVNE